MIWATLSRPFLLDVGDHLFPAVHAEVDVEVGHRDPFGVQEALEQQGVAQGIKVGDRQRIGDEGARARAPARTDGMPWSLAHLMKSATIRK
jgi:hypothetical protein